MILLKNSRSTSGCASNCDYFPEDDGIIVKILKLQGAIPFVKTNIPQGTLFVESANHIWGRA